MTTPSPLQLEAEQIYPYEFGVEIETTDAQRAAHIAAAEKHTAIIDVLREQNLDYSNQIINMLVKIDLLTKDHAKLGKEHLGSLLILSEACSKKDKEIEQLRDEYLKKLKEKDGEIERLRGALEKIDTELEQRQGGALMGMSPHQQQIIYNIAHEALTPTP